MQGQILFLLSDVRSGSTLLEQLLGAHSAVWSVGEVQWLRAYARNDRSLYNPPHEMACACGDTFDDCGFWQAVAARLPKPVRDCHYSARVFVWTGPGAVKPPLPRRAVLKLLRTTPSSWFWPGVRMICGDSGVAKNNIDMFEAVFEETGARYVVDSSKNMFRFRSIYDRCPERCRIIVLNRDHRAAVYSRMKRGVSLDEAARGWARKVWQIQALTRGIHDNDLLHVKYEDICSNPQQELTRICEYLGVEFEAGMLHRPEIDIHDLGGSPSKLDAGRRQIRLDTRYVGAFSDAELCQLNEIVGSAAALAGYEVE